MKNTLPACFSFLLLFSTSLTLSCDSAESGTLAGSNLTYPASATLYGDKDGVDMLTGVIYDGQNDTPTGSWLNSDVYTSASFEDALKLWTGGPRNTQGRPANWFVTGGGATQTFSSLDAVPDSPKPDNSTIGTPSGRVETGHGFIVLASDGLTYFKGFVSAADANSLTIEYEPLP